MNLAEQRILVTGGAGFIGSHLVDALKAAHVRVLDDFSTGHECNLAQHADRKTPQIIRGDITDRAEIDRALDGIDIVFHLACRGVRHSIHNPRQNHEVNAVGTLNLLEAAKHAGVKRFVHVSSSEVYGTAHRVPMDEEHPSFPETIYGAAKLAGEAYTRAFHRTYGLPTVVVRPFNNFGPRSHFEGDSGEVIPRFCVWALCGLPPVIFGDGEQTRDFIYVEDTAHWLCRIAETDALVGRTINLGSGRETTILALAEIVYRLAGRPDLAPVHMEPRPGDVRRHLAGAQLASELIGYAPRIGLEEGIARLLEYLRERYPSPTELLRLMETANWIAQPAVNPTQPAANPAQPAAV
jgi:UDP-glucose 4-epimerase